MCSKSAGGCGTPRKQNRRIPGLFSKIRNRRLRAFCKFLASLRLAVVVLLGIGVVSAYGTIVEAQYDALTAQRLVYHSWWSYLIFAVLSVNLIAVMVDRIPWRKRHLSFLLAHIGILVILGGSLVTRYYGIDGVMRIAVGQSSDTIMLPAMEEITLWSSMGGQQPIPVLDRPRDVDFFVTPPTPEKPYELLPGRISVTGFIPYALRDLKIEPSDLPADGPALRFVLENEMANVADWLVLSTTRQTEMVELGPAKVVFTRDENFLPEGNLILLRPQGKDTVSYTIYTESSGEQRSGVLGAGQALETGWMNLTFRLLNYHDRARYRLDYRPMARPTPMTVSVLKVQFQGKEHLLGLNSNLRLFDDTTMYIMGYGNKRIMPGFAVTLKHFEVGRYQGTMRAASYESLVEVPQEGYEAPAEVLISMNEPMKHQGFTFYQSSFEEDEMGNPTHSILSVNRDPGRFWKYLGSFLVVWGVFDLFYRKARKTPVAK